MSVMKCEIKKYVDLKMLIAAIGAVGLGPRPRRPARADSRPGVRNGGDPALHGAVPPSSLSTRVAGFAADIVA